MDNSNIDSLREIFKTNNKNLLIEMSSKSKKHYIENDLLIKNEHSTLVNLSEIYYGWGVDKNQSILLTHRQFSQMQKCVYGMYLLHYQSP